jgi:hypothetical protein
VRILAGELHWLGPAVDDLRAEHDLVVLDAEAVRGTWAAPGEGWWRRVVPDGWVPDVALFATPEYVPVPPLLSALPCPVVLWVGDWYANWQGVSWISDQAELVLADATGVAALRRAGLVDVAECCPWTWDPRRHHADWDAAPARDVGFVGNLNEALQVRRNRWLGRLAELPAIAHAGWERVQHHGPHQRLRDLVAHLERVAGLGRRRVAALAGPRNTARELGQSATLALSVADTEALAGYELALARAERNAPRDPAVHLAFADLYSTLAATGHPQAAEAMVWSGEHLERAARADPLDAVVALARPQLLYALGDRAIAHAMAHELVVDLLARRKRARVDRLPLIDNIAWRAARQEVLLGGGDPEPELTRLVLVEALKLCADAAPGPVQRAEHLVGALAASGGDPRLRLRAAIVLLAVDPAVACAHTEIVVRELPINAVGWTAHARGLVALGRVPEAAAFVARCLEVSRRVAVPDGMLEQLRASIPELAPTP